MYLSNILCIATAAASVSAYDLPANLKSIYDAHKSGTCKNKISRTYDGGAAFCGDIPGVIFLKGKSGNYDNMDIDCDGANNSGGACSNDPSGQSQTTFKDTVKHYGIKDLDAHIHPYVVFGNDGFDPEDHGVKPLSVVAVVCNDQVFYGIWGDTNGATHTGEASLAMGQLCFPNDDISGDSGHDPKDVLYLGFMGDDAVPGKDGAKWTAKTKEEFEASIKAQGDKLVAGLKA